MDIGRAAVLCAHLHHTLILPSRLDHDASFPDIVRRGLFDEHIHVRLARPDRGGPVPMVACRHAHGVHLGIIEDAAQILHGGYGPVLQPLELVGKGTDARVVGVAYILHPHILAMGEHARVVAAATAQADGGHDNAVIGGVGASWAATRHDSARRAHGGNTFDAVLQKVSALHISLLSSRRKSSRHCSSGTDARIALIRSSLIAVGAQYVSIWRTTSAVPSSCDT